MSSLAGPSADPVRLCGRLPETGEVVTVETRDGRIGAIRSGRHDPHFGEGEEWLTPGFLDLQVNGYAGADFNIGAWADADTAATDVREVFQHAARAGTSLLCPTFTTNSRELMREGMRRTAHLLDSDPGCAAAVAGFHMEGPYISPEDGPRGAHPLEHVRPPDWDEFRELQDVAGGRIRIVTLAPETEGALGFIERVVQTGVTVSLGHTGADPERIQEAIRAGAAMSTHLGNGSHALLNRHRSYFWEQLASDELTASLILDGFHLPRAVARSITRAKGPERVVLVSDAVSMGGLPPGRHGGGRFEVLPEGKIVLAGTPYLAGAGHLLDTCLANAVRFTGVSLATAVRWVTAIPAALIGLAHRKGQVRVGWDADLVLFSLPERGPIRVHATMRQGRVVFAGNNGP